MTSPSLPNEFFADPDTVESAVEGRGRGLGNLFFFHSYILFVAVKHMASSPWL